MLLPSRHTRSSTADYVPRKRALLAQLPETHRLSEVVQLDLVYGGLRHQLRETVFTTFSQLVERARQFEELQQEVRPNTIETDRPILTKARVRCTYASCRRPGHTSEECRKRVRDLTTSAPTPTPPGSKGAPTPACYGCHRRGVIRSQCPTCNPKLPTRSWISAHYLKDPPINPRERPTIRIKVANTEGKSYLDTGAKLSVASHSYQALLKTGHVFRSERAQVAFADGTPRLENLLVTSTAIQLAGRVIKTTVVVFPEAILLYCPQEE